MQTIRIYWLAILLLAFVSKGSLNVDAQLNYCVGQATKTSTTIPGKLPNLPRNVLNGKTTWNYVGYKDWTSGFWPGTLWYLYELRHVNVLVIA